MDLTEHFLKPFLKSSLLISGSKAEMNLSYNALKNISPLPEIFVKSDAAPVMCFKELQPKIHT